MLGILDGHLDTQITALEKYVEELEKQTDKAKNIQVIEITEKNDPANDWIEVVI